jgi:hypothetical protein
MGFKAKTHGRATRSVSAAILLTICVLAAGSCSGGSKLLDKHDYIRQMRAIKDSSAGRRAWRLYDNVVLTQPPLPQARCRARTNELHRTLETIADRIEQLRPQAEVEQLQRRSSSPPPANRSECSAKRPTTSLLAGSSAEGH